ncbi:hypothetical protein BDV96DRAFT_598124 [Lophiotrema nucula]|uniref:Uncharacterized protein n=1 Tax=Lophiotrema nucula TaxID=690887 RepID=A0A6A5ZFQ8_9PLEO|nr:hypothetical protein BDV96DRAFT_598124 [Lophiotrema nucula]
MKTSELRTTLTGKRSFRSTTDDKEKLVPSTLYTFDAVHLLIAASSTEDDPGIRVSKPTNPVQDFMPLGQKRRKTAHHQDDEADIIRFGEEFTKRTSCETTEVNRETNGDSVIRSGLTANTTADNQSQDNPTNTHLPQHSSHSGSGHEEDSSSTRYQRGPKEVLSQKKSTTTAQVEDMSWHPKDEESEDHYASGPARMIKVFDGENHVPALLLPYRLMTTLRDGLLVGIEVDECRRRMDTSKPRLQRKVCDANAKLWEVRAARAAMVEEAKGQDILDAEKAQMLQREEEKASEEESTATQELKALEDICRVTEACWNECLRQPFQQLKHTFLDAGLLQSHLTEPKDGEKQSKGSTDSSAQAEPHVDSTTMRVPTTHEDRPEVHEKEQSEIAREGDLPSRDTPEERCHPPIESFQEQTQAQQEQTNQGIPVNEATNLDQAVKEVIQRVDMAKEARVQLDQHRATYRSREQAYLAQHMGNTADDPRDEFARIFVDEQGKLTRKLIEEVEAFHKAEQEAEKAGLELDAGFNLDQSPCLVYDMDDAERWAQERLDRDRISSWIMNTVEVQQDNSESSGKEDSKKMRESLASEDLQKKTHFISAGKEAPKSPSRRKRDSLMFWRKTTANHSTVLRAKGEKNGDQTSLWNRLKRTAKGFMSCGNAADINAVPARNRSASINYSTRREFRNKIKERIKGLRRVEAFDLEDARQHQHQHQSDGDGKASNDHVEQIRTLDPEDKDGEASDGKTQENISTLRPGKVDRDGYTVDEDGRHEKLRPEYKDGRFDGLQMARKKRPFIASPFEDLYSPWSKKRRVVDEYAKVCEAERLRSMKWKNTIGQSRASDEKAE